jgi:hypothetical protein
LIALFSEAWKNLTATKSWESPARVHFHTLAKAPLPSFTDLLVSYPGSCGGTSPGGSAVVVEEERLDDEEGLPLPDDRRREVDDDAALFPVV